MANIDWPSGLRPVTSGKAGTTPRVRPHVKLTGATTPIYEGDILYRDEGGVKVYNGTTDTQADQIVGVAAHYSAGAAGTEVLVYDDPEQEYIVQCDGADVSTTTNLNQALYRNAPIVYATGNTTTLQSKVELDSSGITSVWTLDTPLQIIRKWVAEDNELGANVKLVVKIDAMQHIETNDSVTHLT